MNVDQLASQLNQLSSASDIPAYRRAHLEELAHELTLVAKRTEPAGYRWRWGKIGSNTAWHLSLEDPRPFAEDGHEVEALYALPIEAVSVIAGQRRHLEAFETIIKSIDITGEQFQRARSNRWELCLDADGEPLFMTLKPANGG